MSANDNFHHVRDFGFFELPQFMRPFLGGSDKLFLPKLNLLGHEFQITKFMVIEVIAALLVIVIMRGLAMRARSGKPVEGAFWNFWETICLFIRDEIVRPSVGEPHAHGHGDHGHGDHGHDDHGHGGHGHDAGHGPKAALAGTGSHFADRFLPYIWSVFFFILFNNLLGAVPMMGSPTGNTGLTAVLAVASLLTVVIAGSQQSGFVGFFKSLVPGMDLPGPIGFVLIPMIWLIEFVGLLVKHGVLAIRLFANIMAGHTVLGVFLAFIAQAAHLPADMSWAFYIITPASIFAQLAIGMLELFVAFLQAYVFSLLSSIFIGAAVNPH